MKRGAIKACAWLALAIPGVWMLHDFATGSVLAMDLLDPAGEMAVRLMILALLPGPLVEIFGPGLFLRTWLMLRRNLGVAAFAYALLHLLFYAADMSPAGMVGELPLPGIWTGWLALALLIPPAAISFDAAVRALGRRWQAMQRLVYLALALGVVHWLLLAWDWPPVALHVAPLILAWLARHARRRTYPRHRSPA